MEQSGGAVGDARKAPNPSELDTVPNLRQAVFSETGAEILGNQNAGVYAAGRMSIRL